MNKIALVLLALAQSLFAQNADGVRGRLYVAVDDRAIIYVNGALAYNAPVGKSESPELALKPGDQIVARLTNLGGDRRFMLLFVSTDRKSVVEFPLRAFRILSDGVAQDFKNAEFAQFKPAVGALGTASQRVQFKSQSAWVWGDAEVSSIGALLTREMFKATSPAALGEAEKPAPGRIALTVEALVDGGSTLHITKDHLYWVNGAAAKPGLHHGKNEPTYVNEKAWMPKWGQPNEPRGVDRTDNFPIELTTLDLKGVLVSNGKERGSDTVDTSRTAIQVRRQGNEILVTIPDPETDSRWYKIVFTGR